ncbi:hypothetical protein HAX54_008715 [Datura stramonium]|uniref:Uncharacterized protein n=1 Tax=Datura stramonium TaxID=4076 RepID=A0ABS8RVV8_DATST|nr:hypothetical protein [Datura stramonium]
MLGPTFSLLGDESQFVCAGSPNPSRGESNLGHENITPDIRILSDKCVDENAKLKGKEKLAEHHLDDENLSEKRKLLPPDLHVNRFLKQHLRQFVKTLMSLLAMKVIQSKGISMSKWILTINRRLNAPPIALFYTVAFQVDIGKSSSVYGTPTNADLKKELNDFRLHIDVKFGEILQEKKTNDCSYSRGGDRVFADLGRDAEEDAYNVSPDITLKVCEVGVGGEKIEAREGVDVGESSWNVNVKEQVSQADFNFISMHESAIAAIPQDYYKNKAAVVYGGVPRQDAAHPTTYVAIEADDTLGKIAGVGTIVVEIGDDDNTPAVYQRTRNRRPGKAQQSPFVAGSDLSEFGSVSRLSVLKAGTL